MSGPDACTADECAHGSLADLTSQRTVYGHTKHSVLGNFILPFLNFGEVGKALAPMAAKDPNVIVEKYDRAAKQ